MSEPIVKKAYYSIGEVCDLTGLKPHVLRYWETQFDILRPTKNRAGNRVYKPKDIELVTLVKNLLYEQKYTIEGANQKLLDMRREGDLKDGQQEVLGPEFLASMKADLEDLARVLSPGVPFQEREPAEDAPGEPDAADGGSEGVDSEEAGSGDGAAASRTQNPAGGKGEKDDGHAPYGGDLFDIAPEGPPEGRE